MEAVVGSTITVVLPPEMIVTDELGRWLLELVCLLVAEGDCPDVELKT